MMDHNHNINNPARIWTFDGGGPSVISQLIIVNEIMHRIQWTLKLDSVPRPCEYADLIVGSGLGAVVVILLARLRLTAEKALTHIAELGQSVFMEANGQDNDYKFDVERLRTSALDILRQYGLTETSQMIEAALSNHQTYAAVTLTPTSNLSTCRLIRTYHTPSAEYNCTVMEAVLATIALPRWFPPVKIGPTFFKESLASGAMGFSNPTKKALNEAKQMFGAEAKASIILSFGSGRRQPRSLQNTTTNQLWDVLDEMAQSGEETAEELSQRFENSTFYYRLSVDSGLENLPITGWSNDELGVITTHTKTYIEKVSSSLRAVAEVLVKNEGVVTLGKLTQVDIKPATAKSIPRLTPFFIQREEVFEVMEQCLIKGIFDTQRIFVLYGMGGSGKTQMASFFARRNRNRYKHIYFVDASSVESIKADLQSAIRSLRGAHSQGAFGDTLSFLAREENQDWLVIFDNADNPELPLTTYLPECEHGTLIITGRNPGLTELAPTSHWHLKGMKESNAIQVLLRAAKHTVLGNEEESKAVNELCNLVGGLPLALVHIGCYCDTSKLTFQQYLERLQKHRSKLMAIGPPRQLDKYSYSVYASIDLSYSLIDEDTRSFLRLLAFFHPSSIPLEILRVASKRELSGNPDWDVINSWTDNHNGEDDDTNLVGVLGHLLTPNATWSDFHIDALLNRLQSCSLISLSNSSGQIYITIHPLVQSCILDTLSPEAYNLHFYMSVFVLSCCSRYEEQGQFQHLPTHVAQLESYKRYIHPNKLAAFAYILYGTGNYEGAMKRWEMVRDECIKRNGEEHRSTLRISHWVAECLYRLEQYERAEMAIRTVIKTQERILGEDDSDTLESYKLLASHLSSTNKAEEAGNMLRGVSASYENMYGEEHWRTLSIQSSVAENLYVQSQYTKAEAILRSILPAMKNAFGEDADITLNALNTLSLALKEQDKWPEAEEIMNEVLATNIKKYGRHHSDTLTSLYNSTIYLVHRSEWNQAEAVLGEIIGVRERTLGKNHPSIIKPRQLLAFVVQHK